MSGAPTYTLKLDDGTGTFPYTVTTYLRLSDGWSITRGRQDEQGSVSPSTLSLTLENTDGRFTLGSTSGGYGAIDLDRGIQFSLTFGATTVKKFTGYVQSWQVEWPAGGQEFAVVRVTAVDRLARLERQTLRSIIEQEILEDEPSVYYTLGEPEGALTAVDTSGTTGYGSPPLRMIGPGAVTFGNGTGPGTDGLTAADFDGTAYLATDTAVGSSSPWSVECFFSITLATDYVLTEMSLSGAGVTGLSVVASVLTAKVNGVSLSGGFPGVITANVTHHAAATYDGTTLRLYLDGYEIANSTPGAGSTPVGTFRLGTGALGAIFVGTMAHAAYYDASVLSAARILAHYNAGSSGFNTESSDARVTRYYDYSNLPVQLALESGVLTAVAHFDITGSSVLAAINRVVDSEGGLLFVRGDGYLVMQNRTHRAAQVAADLALTGQDADVGTAITADLQGVINSAVVTDAFGQPWPARDAASITAHGEYPLTLDILAPAALSASNRDADNAARWLVAKRATPKQRLGSVTVDLMTHATSATVQAVMGLEISDRLSFSSMPSQVTVEDQIIEGWTESGSHNSWSITFNTTPFSLYNAWILGDATYGVLDSTTILQN